MSQRTTATPLRRIAARRLSPLPSAPLDRSCCRLALRRSVGRLAVVIRVSKTLPFQAMTATETVSGQTAVEMPRGTHGIRNVIHDYGCARVSIVHRSQTVTGQCQIYAPLMAPGEQ